MFGLNEMNEDASRNVVRLLLNFFRLWQEQRVCYFSRDESNKTAIEILQSSEIQDTVDELS